MLNWFTKQKSGKSDHPLGSEAAIAEYLSGLAPGRPETNLMELVDWLGEPEQLARALPAEALIRAVIKLDETGEKSVSECWRLILAEKQVDHLGEQKLKTLDTYYLATHASYRHLLGVLARNPGAAGKNLTVLNGLFAQRSMCALSGRLRIFHIRYRNPDGAWWEAVASTLLAAQEAGVVNLKQRTYPDAAVPASPWVEYLVALFFEIAPLGNLVPQQMDLLYRLLMWLEPHFMVQNSFSSQSPYYVHLDRPAAPVKASEALPADPKLVYFGPGLAYGQLVRLRTMLKQSGELPDWMKVSLCPFERALQVVDSLIMHWSERPPERLFKRERKEARVLVVNGFNQIRRMIAFSEFARSGRKIGYKTHFEMLKFERSGFADSTGSGGGIDEEKWENATPLETVQLLETSGDKQMMDAWSMKDVSATGLGAIVPFLKPWILIGAYIGYRLDDEVDWRIGIIRRIHRVQSGHPSVGIESVPETPHCAQVLPMDLMSGSDPWAEMLKDHPNSRLHDAIVLSMTEGRMLLPTGQFEEGKVMALIMSGTRVPVRLISIVHQNPDCDCVQYEFCERIDGTQAASR